MAKERLSDKLRASGNPYGLILGSRKFGRREDGQAEISSSLLCLDSSGSIDLGDDIRSSLSSCLVVGSLGASSTEGNLIKTGRMMLPQLALMGEMVLKEKEIRISEKRIAFGGVSVKTAQFRGKEPFFIKDESGNMIDVVEPGRPFLMIHVNGKLWEYREMDPVKRVKAFKNDFENLCKLLNNPLEYGLSEAEFNIVEKYQKAPMIGVSHLAGLVKLVDEKIPIWKIDELPGFLQNFHQIDSQLVSMVYGGKRKVDKSDVGVVYITSKTRGQMVNNL